MLKKKIDNNIVDLPNRYIANSGELPIEEINHLFDEATFFFCAEEYEEAIKCFERILRLDPFSKIALTYMGLALERLERHSEALRVYERALSC